MVNKEQKELLKYLEEVAEDRVYSEQGGFSVPHSNINGLKEADKEYDIVFHEISALGQDARKLAFRFDEAVGTRMAVHLECGYLRGYLDGLMMMKFGKESNKNE